MVVMWSPTKPLSFVSICGLLKTRTYGPRACIGTRTSREECFPPTRLAMATRKHTNKHTQRFTHERHPSPPSPVEGPSKNRASCGNLVGSGKQRKVDQGMLRLEFAPFVPEAPESDEITNMF